MHDATIIAYLGEGPGKREDPDSPVYRQGRKILISVRLLHPLSFESHPLCQKLSQLWKPSEPFGL